VSDTDEGDLDALTEQIATILQEANKTVAVAESLTGGQISCRLSAGGSASDWFAGGLVAYAPHVKFAVLEVEPGPVISERAAEQMATGVARLLKADFAVSTTGAGGPGPEEGNPAGTVYIGVAVPGHVSVEKYLFDGDPGSVVHQSTLQALRDLARALTERSDGGDVSAAAGRKDHSG
jgi:nicotinamide-nucleotide amidase